MGYLYDQYQFCCVVVDCMSVQPVRYMTIQGWPLQCMSCTLTITLVHCPIIPNSVCTYICINQYNVTGGLCLYILCPHVLYIVARKKSLLLVLISCVINEQVAMFTTGSSMAKALGRGLG